MNSPKGGPQAEREFRPLSGTNILQTPRIILSRIHDHIHWMPYMELHKWKGVKEKNHLPEFHLAFHVGFEGVLVIWVLAVVAFKNEPNIY